MSAPPVLPTAGFSIIDNDVLLNPNISIEAKASLGLLKYFDRGNGRGCFARKETLCHFLSVSPYRLRKALTELKDLGLITIQRRGQGNPDLIRIIRQEGPRVLEPLQTPVEEVEEGLEPDPVDEVAIGLPEELDPVVEEPPEVAVADLPEAQETSGDSDRQDVEIKTGEISPVEHYKEEHSKKKIRTNTLSKEFGTAKPLDTNPEKKPCDELIAHFYRLKDGRKPTRNEVFNWRPTATRLLNEFSLDELRKATPYAIAKGARLFYYVALIGPGYILEQRRQKENELHRAQIDSKTVEEQNERKHRLGTMKENSRAYGRLTEDLLKNLSMKLRPQDFNAWFKDAFIANITQDTLTLAVPSQGTADWIRERYTTLIQEISGRSCIEFMAC